MAGANVPSTTSADGKKARDFSLNLVPFIDLLSVLISFLLMTAVWTQVSKIDVQAGPEPAGAPAEPADDETTAIEIMIKASGYEVARAGAERRQIERKDDRWDVGALDRALEAIVAADARPKQVTLYSEDRIPYQEVIRVMDACLARSLSRITVAGVDG